MDTGGQIVPPSMLPTACFYASLEYFRCKVKSLVESFQTKNAQCSSDPLRVLSVESGSIQYDAAMLQILQTFFPKLECIIVGATGPHERLREDAVVKGSIAGIYKESLLQIVQAKREEYSELGKFDMIHCPAWRKQFGTQIPDALDTCVSLLKPGGCMYVFTFANAGAFSLRDKLWSQLGPPPDTDTSNNAANTTNPTSDSRAGSTTWIGLRPETYVAKWVATKLQSNKAHQNASDTATATHNNVNAAAATSDGSNANNTSRSVQALCAGPQYDWLIWRERVDSHMDVTNCVGEILDDVGTQTLNEILAHNVRAIFHHSSDILDDIISEICDLSLDGDGTYTPAIVYVPLDAYVIRKPNSTDHAMTSSPCIIRQIVDIPNDKALPLLPIDIFAMSAAGSPTPVDNALMITRWLRAHPEVAANPHQNVKLCPFKGSWGSFIGTGSATASAAAVVRNEILAEQDRRRREKISTNEPLVRASRSELDAPTTELTLTRDPWYPHGENGSFFNAGLQNWVELREAWTARASESEPSNFVASFDVDLVVADLSKLCTRYELPKPLPLPVLIDLYVDIWDDGY